MCLTPMTIKREAKGVDGRITRVVGCGRCSKCLRKKQIDWFFRLEQELKVSESACFLTLTYDEDTLPWAERPTLVRRDFQLFMKRLRKHASTSFKTRKNPPKIKYYACGEYGDKTERPHYHAIMFNLPRPFDRFISKAWKYGHVHIGSVTEGSIMYTTKYALKGLKRKDAFDYDEFGREPQFTLMSNGLGEAYNDPQIREYLRSHGTKLLTLQGGHKKKLPRYYIDKMFPDTPEGQIAKAEWSGEAYRELNHHHNNQSLTDQQRADLIRKDQHTNNRKIMKGDL